MNTMNTDPIYHLTFLRHGESVGNAENRLQGLADFPLSDAGRLQARKLAARWKAEGISFDTVIASPLSRALETARIIATELGLPSVETDPLWVERDMGKRSGLTMAEIRAQFTDPDFVSLYTSWGEEGESDWALYLRGGQALHKLLQRPPARYLVVSHGAILSKVFFSILGITPQPNSHGVHFRMENTSFSKFRYNPASHHWRVDIIGDTAHLKNVDK
jgi:broad specificity phosphatase PhoE